jgi:(1->4)-alpha-D-glucan 1-alpha-D-glucosylmutase
VFIQRVQEFMTKAVHEAKVNLSWVNQNPEYVEALQKFIERILTPGTESRPNRFLQLIQPFVMRIAFFGAMNSISQTLLKITSPGVPDIYQGQELLDFSMVDPDNRRPVDFRQSRMMLDDLRQRGTDSGLLDELLHDWPDGRAKMWVIWKGLEWRQGYRELTQRGSYGALEARGPYGNHIVAFTRSLANQMSITIAPRFAFTLTQGETRPPTGEIWYETTIHAPAAANKRFRNALTGEEVLVGSNGVLRIADVLRRFPAALLVTSG